jgi:2-aminobenzoate-CoA ligase
MTDAVTRSAHVDTFCQDMLPPRPLWPVLEYDPAIPALAYPPRLNCAQLLLDDLVQSGSGDRSVIRTPKGAHWSYAELQAKANQIAHILVDECRLVPGNRVLLRAPNTPMLAACWFAVMKAGGVVVCTMPLLRVRELRYVMEKAQIALALCDSRIAEECARAVTEQPNGKLIRFGTADDELELLMRSKPTTFQTVDTSADDTALIAFTSGTTGRGKGTMHTHRDVMAITDCFPRDILEPTGDDVFCGSPPLAFTYALGGLLLFPMRFGASVLLLEQATPPHLIEAIHTYKPTVLFTAPTAYRAMLGLREQYDLSSLRRCVSAGETLPRATYDAWLDATGLKIIDGIGATEMLHIFISAADENIRPGATGRAVAGYRAKLVDDEGNDVPVGTIGRLAVRGPTGCRYLDDEERQQVYVQNGWNLTGDSYRMDEDGYFWYQARTDDMILSAGYNIAGIEVENVLLDHPAVQECAVIGVPDEERGQIVKAFIVLRPPMAEPPPSVKELQDFVKSEIAPYKYPRQIEFVTQLPRTETGKLQRFKLREDAAEQSQ